MVVSGNLTGLTTGLTVQSSTGTELGTISRIVTDKNGNIRTVFVTSSTGQVVRLSPAMISLSGGIVTLATATLPTRGAPTTNPAIGVSQGPLHASATGIAHANSHSVLAGGAVAGTTLPGLTTGLTVTNANGTNIGTISQIVTDTSGNIRLVIVTNSTTGLNFRLAPTTLTISGNMVETTSTVGG
jgi:sporulation protein YlmC with PRC-barrel domain